jgi:hypothetical protein
MPVQDEPSRALARPDILDSSRLAVLSAIGAASAAVPLPFLPSTIERYLRGAVIQDVAARHGLSMTPDAREALAAVLPHGGARRVLSGGTTYFVRRFLRRMGPLGVLAPARVGTRIFALGLLFERYVQQVRRDPAVRVHADEARRLREAVDAAIVRAFSPSLTPSVLSSIPPLTEDFRDERTRFLDGILLAGASLPGYMVRRIEGAFDEVIAESPELVDG